MSAQVLLLSGNPSRRRRSGKRRSAAQRAATARMLAANRSRRVHRNPSKRRRRKSTAVAVARPRSVSRRSSRRIARRSGASRSMAGVGRNLMSMVKVGAVGGGGALLADIGMGFVAQQFPTSGFATKLNADGTINPMYYAAKGALVYVMGAYGGRVTRYAPAMAQGAFAVMLYEVMKSFIPAGSVPMAGMGYFNPARVVQGGIGGMNRILAVPRTMGKIVNLPNASSSQGAIAANAMRLARARRA